jgi:hypothetical protein
VNFLFQEGRFLKCKGSFGIEDAMQKCLDGYENMKKIISKYKKSYILQYDADFDIDTFNELNAYKFDNLDKYKLEEEYDVEKYIEKNRLMTVHYSFKNLDYDKIVTLIFDSTY